MGLIIMLYNECSESEVLVLSHLYSPGVGVPTEAGARSAVLCWRIEAGHSSDQLSLTSAQPLQPNLDVDSAPTLCVIYLNSDDSNDTEHKKIHNPFPNHQKVES